MQRLRFLLHGLVPALALAGLLAAGGAWAQGDPPEPAEEPAPAVVPEGEGLDAVLQLVRDQRSLIERQEETIRALEERLDKVESLALTSHNRLEELDARASAPTGWEG